MFEFPCIFSFKIFGPNNNNFRTTAVQIIETRFKILRTQTKQSKSNQYLSLTFEVQAEDQAALDKVYQALSDSPEILMAL